MLAGVRTEVLKRIDQGREEARAENQKLDGKIEKVDAKIDAVRAELKGDIQKVDAKVDAVRAELKGDIQKVDAKVDAVRAELHEMRAELKGDIHGLNAAVHEVKAGMARIEVLVEEQNARNRIVLDGIAALLSRQNQVEQRVAQVEDTVRNLAAAPPA